MSKIVVNKKISKKSNEISSKLIEKVHKSESYRQNKMQIDCIKKVLVEHDYVPEILLDWLIKSAEDNVKLECQTVYGK